jgi:hypothetical protein
MFVCGTFSNNMERQPRRKIFGVGCAKSCGCGEWRLSRGCARVADPVGSAWKAFHLNLYKMFRAYCDYPSGFTVV